MKLSPMSFTMPRKDLYTLFGNSSNMTIRQQLIHQWCESCQTIDEYTAHKRLNDTMRYQNFLADLGTAFRDPFIQKDHLTNQFHDSKLIHAYAIRLLRHISHTKQAYQPTILVDRLERSPQIGDSKERVLAYRSEILQAVFNYQKKHSDSWDEPLMVVSKLIPIKNVNSALESLTDTIRKRFELNPNQPLYLVMEMPPYGLSKDTLWDPQKLAQIGSKKNTYFIFCMTQSEYHHAKKQISNFQSVINDSHLIYPRNSTNPKDPWFTIEISKN